MCKSDTCGEGIVDHTCFLMDHRGLSSSTFVLLFSSCNIALKVFKTNTYVALRTGISSVQSIIKQYLLVGHYNFVLLLYFYFESEVDNQTNKGILKIRVCLHTSGD